MRSAIGALSSFPRARQWSLPLLACMLLFTGSSQAATLNPGDVLRIEFTTDPGAFPCPAGDCDVLGLLLAFHVAATPGSHTIEARLLDGPALLGTFATEPALIAYRGDGSLFGATYPVVSFSTINDGTIAGVIELRATADPIRYLNLEGFQMFLGHSTSEGNSAYDPRSIELLKVEIVTAAPEPATVWLVAPIGLLIAGRKAAARARRAG